MIFIFKNYADLGHDSVVRNATPDPIPRYVLTFVNWEIRWTSVGQERSDMSGVWAGHVGKQLWEKDATPIVPKRNINEGVTGSIIRKG